MKRFLQRTELLNYKAKIIQILIRDKKWMELDDYTKIVYIYNFVKDEILFSFSKNYKAIASHVLKDNCGNAFNKAILLMALLRAVGIPCRIHAYNMHKKVFRGLVGGFSYLLMPSNLLTGVVEIYFQGNWYDLEAVAIDSQYLMQIQDNYKTESDLFVGYGIAINRLTNPSISFNRCHTHICKEAYTDDLERFDDPDVLFENYRQRGGIIRVLYFNLITRPLSNKKIKKIRANK